MSPLGLGEWWPLRRPALWLHAEDGIIINGDLVDDPHEIAATLAVAGDDPKSAPTVEQPNTDSVQSLSDGESQKR